MLKMKWRYHIQEMANLWFSTLTSLGVRFSLSASKSISNCQPVVQPPPSGGSWRLVAHDTERNCETKTTMQHRTRIMAARCYAQCRNRPLLSSTDAKALDVG